MIHCVLFINMLSCFLGEGGSRKKRYVRKRGGIKSSVTGHYIGGVGVGVGEGGGGGGG